LLRLTEYFDLTFPLSDEAESIIPCLLPPDEPQVKYIYFVRVPTVMIAVVVVVDFIVVVVVVLA